MLNYAPNGGGEGLCPTTSRGLAPSLLSDALELRAPRGRKREIHSVALTRRRCVPRKEKCLNHIRLLTDRSVSECTRQMFGCGKSVFRVNFPRSDGAALWERPDGRTLHDYRLGAAELARLEAHLRVGLARRLERSLARHFVLWAAETYRLNFGGVRLAGRSCSIAWGLRSTKLRREH
jgi:hypothetical protein